MTNNVEGEETVIKTSMKENITSEEMVGEEIVGNGIVSEEAVGMESRPEEKTLMQAMVATRYGAPDVMRLQEVERPTPAENEVLVKVEAAAANAGDWHLVRGDPFLMRLEFGLFRPKFPILGADVAGQVVAVGRAVTRFQPGDAVFGDLSGGKYGAFAEYVAAPEEALALRPPHVTSAEAAAAPSAALTALQGLRDRGEIAAGQQVLINGASGGVGSFAVQIAKALGAEVTAVCSTRNIGMMRGMGADHVIDYTQEDYTRSGKQYDLILDTAAFRSLAEIRRALAPAGTYVLVGGSFGRFLQAMIQGPWLSKQGGQQFRTFIKHANQADLDFVRELLETGKVQPVIEKRYPLSGVPDALRHLEAGHTQGKSVILVENER